MSKKDGQKKKDRERRVAKEKLAEAARRKAKLAEEGGKPKNRSSKILSAAVPKAEIPSTGKPGFAPGRLGG